jgi:hypothetical protein
MVDAETGQVERRPEACRPCFRTAFASARRSMYGCLGLLFSGIVSVISRLGCSFRTGLQSPRQYSPVLTNVVPSDLRLSTPDGS